MPKSVRSCCGNCKGKFRAGERQVDKILSSWDFKKAPEEIKVNEALFVIFEMSPLPSLRNLVDVVKTQIFTTHSIRICAPCAKLLSLLYNAFMDFKNVCQVQSDVAIALGQLNQLQQAVFVNVSNKKRRITNENNKRTIESALTSTGTLINPETQDVRHSSTLTDTDGELIKPETVSDSEFELETYEEEGLEDILHELPSSPSRSEVDEVNIRRSLRVRTQRHESYTGLGYDNDNRSQDSDEYVTSSRHDVKRNKRQSANDEDDNEYKDDEEEFNATLDTFKTTKIGQDDPQHLQRKCGDCGEILGKIFALRRHYQNLHPDHNVIIKCDQTGCMDHFEDDRNYRLHQIEAHNLSVYIPPAPRIRPNDERKPKSSRQDDLEKQRNSNEIRWDDLRRCGYCSSTFCRTLALKRHINKKHPNKPYKIRCDRDKCQASFLGEHFDKELKNHLINEHGLKRPSRKQGAVAMVKEKIMYNPNNRTAEELERIKIAKQRRYCGYCDQIYQNSIVLRRHILSVHVGSEYLVKCPHERCDAVFEGEDKYAYQDHLKTAHTYEETEAMQLRQPKPEFQEFGKKTKAISVRVNKRYVNWNNARKCGHCNQVYSNMFALNRHSRTFHAEKGLIMKCNVDGDCNGRFINDEDYRSHLKNIHGGLLGHTNNHGHAGKKPAKLHIECGLCVQDLQFSRLSQLEKHVKEDHGLEEGLLIRCMEMNCGYLFDSEDEFRKHGVEAHCHQIQHACPVCELEFDRPLLLECHLNRIHQARTDICVRKISTNSCKKVICHICGKMVRSGTVFRDHLSNHQIPSRTKIKCPYCSRLIIQDNLATHYALRHANIAVTG